MSSNRDSPTDNIKRRHNKTRKNAVEYQERILSQVREMFDPILDPDVILSVIQNCNWKLRPSIDHLITLSANVNSSKEKNTNADSCNEDLVIEKRSASADNPDSGQEDDAFEVDTDFTYLNINDEELQKQKDEFKKFELMKQNTQDFPQENCHSQLPLANVINESPLETVEDEEIKITQRDCVKESDVDRNTFLKRIVNEFIDSERAKDNQYPEIASEDNLTQPRFSTDEKNCRKYLTCDQNQLPSFNSEDSSSRTLENPHSDPNPVSHFKTEEKRKTETESLCGLKIQYRFGGSETSSDDDADVVIEEESSDCSIQIPQDIQTNVCQFLSSSSQNHLKTTQSQMKMINSPSFSYPVNNYNIKTCYKFTQDKVKLMIQNNFKIMVIMRGLPGCGKSYLAKDIVKSTKGGNPMQYIFSTDDFFVIKGRGVYEYDPMRISDAHAFNQQRVLKAVRNGISPVIVDNTNTQCWEIQPYLTMAVQYGYFVEVLEPDTPWAYNVKELVRRNLHGVAKESIQRMLERFERNLTAEKLLRMFSLKYDPQNTPPQLCIPLFSPTKSKREFNLDSDKSKKENRKSNRKNKKLPLVEEKLEDYIPTGFSNARVVDAIPNPYNENLTALQLAMKTFGGDDDDLSPKENAQDLIEDKWEDDGISWEDETLKMENKSEDSSTLKDSDDLKNSLNENSTSMDNKVNNNSESSHLNLGAIGSERKSSIVKNMFVNDSNELDNKNVLSQCWDFTLLLDGRQIHSVETSSENENDEDKRHENVSEKSDSSAISDSSVKFNNFDESDSLTKSDDSDNLKSLSDELKEMQSSFEKDSPNYVTKSPNTESFEHIDPMSDDSFPVEVNEVVDMKGNIATSIDYSKNREVKNTKEKNYESLNIDSQAKVSFGSIMKFFKKSFLSANHDISKGKKIEIEANCLQGGKVSETVNDSLSEKLHSPVKEHSSCNTKILDYGIELNLDSDSKDTLSKKLSVTSQRSEKENKNLVFEIQSNFENIESMESETIIRSNNDIFDLSSFEHKVSSDNDNLSHTAASNISSEKNCIDLDSEDYLTSILFKSEFNLGESSSKLESIKLIEPLTRTVLSIEENEKLILEEKELIKSEKSSDAGNFDIKNVETEQYNTSSQDSETIDNINSITWKESPFPACNIEVALKIEEPKVVTTSEASTNTNIYDFNVLYIGGTNEPQYKVLNTFNRNINEGLISNNEETPPPRKLKLDKSSMTNEVDVLLELPTVCGGINETDKDIIQGLIDMFPYFSKDYVVDVYTNVCKGDSHWAIDVLLEGVSTEGILKAQSLKSENSSSRSSSIRSKRVERLKQSSSSDSNESESSSRSRKREKNHISEDTLALKKHLEERVTISEASYHPHILRVKKWKNREPDASIQEIMEAQARNTDVIQFANDINPNEVVATESPGVSEQTSIKEREESDGEDSSESDETMELNLGWEFITNLEKQFGNPNFQLPDGLFPVIQIKKSLAEEIHALWRDSMQLQMDTQQEHLDAMIAKDAEYAKTLEVEEAKALSNSAVPNLNEIMDMELALAVYKNDLKKQKVRETPLDMASRLTRQMLNEMFPTMDSDTLSEILKAHNGNFKETVEVLETSTGRSVSSVDTLNKQNSLMDKVKQQSIRAKEEGDTSKLSSVTNADLDTNTVDQLTYEYVLQTAREFREEAERQFLLRNENFNKAAAAYRRGNPSVASYYSEMAKLHSKKMENANSAAASGFLAAQNHSLCENNTLDLHNLFVPEALQALDIFLDHEIEVLNRGTKKSAELFIITGRGARSNNNKSKLKPAISRKLTSRNISFSEANPGCLKVKLYRHNSILN